MPELTVKDLATRVGLPARRVAELMSEDAARGVVEIDRHGRWRLTPEAEEEFGFTLRNLMAPTTMTGRRLPDGGPYAPSGPLGNLDELGPQPARPRGAQQGRRAAASGNARRARATGRMWRPSRRTR